MFTRISVVQAWLIEREPSRTMILDSTDANTLRSAYEDLRRNPACECNELESLQSAHARERSGVAEKTGFANAIRIEAELRGAVLSVIIGIVHRLCSAYTNSRSPSPRASRIVPYITGVGGLWFGNTSFQLPPCEPAA